MTAYPEPGFKHRGRRRSMPARNEDYESVAPESTRIHQQTKVNYRILDIYFQDSTQWKSKYGYQLIDRGFVAGSNQTQNDQSNNRGNQQYQQAADHHPRGAGHQPRGVFHRHRGADHHHRCEDRHHRCADHHHRGAQTHFYRGGHTRPFNRQKPGRERDDQNHGECRDKSAGSSRQDNVSLDKHNRKRDDSDDYHLSRFLTNILRHNADKHGLSLMKGGFLYVDDILKLNKSFHGNSLKDIQRIVSSDEKQRFALKLDEESKKMMIRAILGHTLEFEEVDLTPITSFDADQLVLHGTYFASWYIIQTEGLSKMRRKHIHFTGVQPGDSGVISGMTSSCEVIIYLDVKKCLEGVLKIDFHSLSSAFIVLAGLKFYWSANNVILCSGDKDGVIYPCYFAAVFQLKPRISLEFDRSISCVQKVIAKDMTRKKKGRNRKNKENENGDDENKIFKENEGTGILSQAASWRIENLSDAEEENLAQVEGSRAADDIWKERLTEPCRADTTSSYRSSQEKMPVGREVTPAKEATAVHESHHLPFAWCGELIEPGQTADVRNSGGLSVLISDIISDGVETEVVGFLILKDSVDRGIQITTNIERLSVNQKKLNEEGIKLRNSIRQSSYELHLENSKKIS